MTSPAARDVCVYPVGLVLVPVADPWLRNTDDPVADLKDAAIAVIPAPVLLGMLTVNADPVGGAR